MAIPWWRSWLQSNKWDNVSIQRPIWFHAASVGETRTCAPLIAQAVDKYPVLVSNRSRRALEWNIPLVDSLVPHRVLAPTEFQVNVFLNKINPRLAVFVESELWPNLIHQTRARGCRLALVNARLSDKSFARWNSTRLTRRILKSMLESFEFIHAQSEKDVERNQDVLGGDDHQHMLIGNLKPAAALHYSRASHHNEQLGQVLETIEPGWAAVSLHPGEVEVVIEASKLLHQKEGKQTPLVIVERHPSKRSSDIVFSHGEGVYVVNCMGVIEQVCSWAAKGRGAVLIGGSLPSSQHKGGHNIFEPLIQGCRILHGPHMDAFQSDLSLLKPRDAQLVMNAVDIAFALENTRHPPSPSLKQERKEMFQSSEVIVQQVWKGLDEMV